MMQSLHFGMQCRTGSESPCLQRGANRVIHYQCDKHAGRVGNTKTIWNHIILQVWKCILYKLGSKEVKKTGSKTVKRKCNVKHFNGEIYVFNNHTCN